MAYMLRSESDGRIIRRAGRIFIAGPAVVSTGDAWILALGNDDTGARSEIRLVSRRDGNDAECREKEAQRVSFHVISSLADMANTWPAYRHLPKRLIT